MRPIMDFSDCLKETLKNVGISASELSRRMLFHSRNSVFRVLNNEVSYEKQLEFFDRLKASGAIELTGEEWAALETGLEVSRVGKRSYVTHMAVRDLVTPSDMREHDMRFIAFDGVAWQAEETESGCLRQIFEGNDVHLLVVGCCITPLFREIGTLMDAARRDGRNVRITHYMHASGAELICAVAAIQPVIFDDCYQAYVLGREVAPEETLSLFQCNMMLAEYTDAHGKRQYVHIVMPEYGKFYFCTYGESTVNDYIGQLIATYDAQAVPLKASFANPSCPEEYLWYTAQYYDLERGASLYDIKSDVPINYIHPDILLGSVKEGFAECDFGDEATRNQLIESLYEIQLKRWKNFFENRKVTHTVFTYDSMRRFALTGSQSDHFFAMRPYTVSERREILHFLKEQNAKNPYFSIYFFKKDVQPVQSEIGIYEDKGVLLTKENTDYRLDGGHAEALITQSEFCAEFKDYFLKQILMRDATSMQETQAIMDELIDLCRE